MKSYTSLKLCKRANYGTNTQNVIKNRILQSFLIELDGIIKNGAANHYVADFYLSTFFYLKEAYFSFGRPVAKMIMNLLKSFLWKINNKS